MWFKKISSDRDAANWRGRILVGGGLSDDFFEANLFEIGRDYVSRNQTDHELNRDTNWFDLTNNFESEILAAWIIFLELILQYNRRHCDVCVLIL